ncbi:MAG: efflux RND transporter periplasmic adaptor subunit [Massilibacteroides sp.]|nr:efflux RND transporter periplasmic adaptor subunit [Massilibacteroides sp.]MDD3061622.1 efflux RND transporter periplasmic adaptor subunit [Massilibacteroides sp.]MDD4115104.1 efflux RND transporter periplasmic adaptor subunit [Massilibacteroides sp.]MDD4659994.1 efflux RND transporter periplasmic adaptor subunit [Massilibacteroides sp.]
MKKILVIISGITLFFLGACSNKKESKEIIPFVKTTNVLPHKNRQEIILPGKIKASLDVNLSFKVSGTIQKMYVNAGDYVRHGQLLAEMDPKDYEIQLSATEAEYKQIKGEAERIIALYERGSVTKNDYEKAVYGLKQITAKYDAHKKVLNDTRLYAPFDGYIQKRLFQPNETIAAGYPVFSMINAGKLEVEINIASSDYMKKERFTDYSCAIDVLEGQIFPLELIAINQKANMNQLYTMRLAFKEQMAHSSPTPGMTTMVSIYYQDESDKKVSIPLSAVFEKNSESYVWIYNPQNQQIKMQKIKIAEILLNGTVILSEGPEAGEMVVAAGVHSLKEGEKVKPLASSSPTNIGGLL